MQRTQQTYNPAGLASHHLSPNDATSLERSADFASLEQRLREATFISRFMGATSTTLVPKDICSIAARHLYDFVPYRSIVFTLAPEFGLTPLSFAPGKSRELSPLLPKESAPGVRYKLFKIDDRLQGSVLSTSSAETKGFEIVIPGNLGTVRIFFGSLSMKELSSTLLAELTAHFARTLKNAFLHEQVKELAMKDALTGLFNRRVFDELLAVEMNRKELMPISLLLIDLDDFKKINDTFGHQAGDEVLSVVGRIMREGCRGSDLVARYGGEEFAVMLPSTNSSIAFDIAQRLRTRIAGTVFVFNGRQVSLTASIGIAFSAVGTSDQIASLINRADQALYRAKKNGKNMSYVYTSKAVDLNKRPNALKSEKAWLKTA